MTFSSGSRQDRVPAAGGGRVGTERLQPSGGQGTNHQGQTLSCSRTRLHPLVLLSYSFFLFFYLYSSIPSFPFPLFLPPSFPVSFPSFLPFPVPPSSLSPSLLPPLQQSGCEGTGHQGRTRPFITASPPPPSSWFLCRSRDPSTSPRWTWT